MRMLAMVRTLGMSPTLSSRRERRHLSDTKWPESWQKQRPPFRSSVAKAKAAARRSERQAKNATKVGERVRSGLRSRAGQALPPGEKPGGHLDRGRCRVYSLPFHVSAGDRYG